MPGPWLRQFQAGSPDHVRELLRLDPARRARPGRKDLEDALRLCPAPGCGAPLRLGHLVCKPCWYAVPKAEQHAVNQSWTALRAAMRGVTRQNLPAYREKMAQYRTATEAAIVSAQRARPS